MSSSPTLYTHQFYSDFENYKFKIQKKTTPVEEDIDSEVEESEPLVQEEFEFNFVNQTLLVSQGRFVASTHKSNGGVYEFLVTSPTTFVLSFVYDHAEKKDFEIKRLVGKKIVANPVPSFFSRYGITIMIAVFCTFLHFIFTY